MKVFIVHAHHEPRSMNGALTGAATEALARAGHEVEVSDLYAMRFDPVSDRRNFTSVKDETYLKQQLEEMHAVASSTFAPDVAAEMRKVEACDLMIWQFPLWWFGLPAILKGWVDRVFAMGFAYGGGKIYETGPFRGKRALLSLTTGGPQASYVEGGFNGDLDGILRPVQRGNGATDGVPGILAHEDGGAPPRRFEGADVRAALHEPLFVEQPVGGEEILAVHVTHLRRPVVEADGEVRRTIVQRIAPPLVEADHDIEWHGLHAGRRARRAIGFVEVVGEGASGAGDFAHAPFHEIAGQRRLGEMHHLRARLEGGGLRTQPAHTGKIAGRVPLTGSELAQRDGQRTNRITWHIRKITANPPRIGPRRAV